jgi:hypothetical protein
LLRGQNPDVYRRLRINFIGTNANPIEQSSCLVHDLAQAEAVADIVQERPARLPYLQALAVQANSDGLLLLGSDEPHYTASKIYGALMSGRPFLSVFHRASSAHEILRKAGGGIAIGFAGATELENVPRVIADALVQLVTNQGALGKVNPVAYAPYEASAIARRFGEIFDRLSDDARESCG